MGEKLKAADFDVCECGDYRVHHKNGVGACAHNKPHDLTHGYKDCMQFRIAKPAASPSNPEPSNE